MSILSKIKNAISPKSQEPYDASGQEDQNMDDELGSVEDDQSTESGAEEKDVHSFMPTIKSSMAKKGAKFAVIGLMGVLVVYKMFLQDALWPKKIATPADAAKKQKSKEMEIDLQKKRKGGIAKKDVVEEAPVVVSEDDTKYKNIKLDEPDLPPLPDMTYEDEGSKRSAFELPSVESAPNGDSSSGSLEERPEGMPNSISLNNQKSDNIGEGLDVEEKRSRAIFLQKGQFSRKKYSNAPSGIGQGRGKTFFIYDSSGIPVEQKEEDSYGSVSRVGHLEETLIQGKIIDAILETSINSEMGGKVRGVVSKNIYGERREKILIPYGSRLYGSYAQNVARGQTRIMIAWNRIIRPDGVSIAIDAEAADQFGNAGVEGDTDSRFLETISKSLLFSMTTLGAAAALQKLGVASDQSQIIYPNGSLTTTNINPVNVAAQSAIKTASDMASNILGDSSKINPVLYVPHGTKIKVIVNQDLRIPPFKG